MMLITSMKQTCQRADGTHFILSLITRSTCSLALFFPYSGVKSPIWSHSFLHYS